MRFHRLTRRLYLPFAPPYPSAPLRTGKGGETVALYACNLMTMPTWSVSLLLVVIWVVGSGMSGGVCRVEEGTDPRVMVRELTGTCSEEDRQALAVSADDVLAALRQGNGVALQGVVLVGRPFPGPVEPPVV